MHTDHSSVSCVTLCKQHSNTLFAAPSCISVCTQLRGMPVKMYIAGQGLRVKEKRLKKKHTRIGAREEQGLSCAGSSGGRTGLILPQETPRVSLLVPTYIRRDFPKHNLTYSFWPTSSSWQLSTIIILLVTFLQSVRVCVLVQMCKIFLLLLSNLIIVIKKHNSEDQKQLYMLSGLHICFGDVIITTLANSRNDYPKKHLWII